MGTVHWEILIVQSILWKKSDPKGLKGPFLSVLAVHLWRLALNTPTETTMNDPKEYTMYFPQLPHYLTVVMVVNDQEDIASILVRSTIHVNTEVQLPMQYSIDYARDKPNSVEADVLSAVVKRFGLTAEPLKYS